MVSEFTFNKPPCTLEFGDTRVGELQDSCQPGSSKATECPVLVELGLRPRSQCRARGGSQLLLSGLPGLSVHISLLTFPFREVLRAAGHLAYSFKINISLAYSYTFLHTADAREVKDGTHGAGTSLAHRRKFCAKLAPHPLHPRYLCSESSTAHECRARQWEYKKKKNYTLRSVRSGWCKTGKCGSNSRKRTNCIKNVSSGETLM